MGRLALCSWCVPSITMTRHDAPEAAQVAELRLVAVRRPQAGAG
jgi:hypothetical protein